MQMIDGDTDMTEMQRLQPFELIGSPAGFGQVQLGSRTQAISQINSPVNLLGDDRPSIPNFESQEWSFLLSRTALAPTK